ncbi:hypothetical protein V1477_012685, partial [Vespula maculifrons]
MAVIYSKEYQYCTITLIINVTIVASFLSDVELGWVIAVMLEDMEYILSHIEYVLALNFKQDKIRKASYLALKQRHLRSLVLNTNAQSIEFQKSNVINDLSDLINLIQIYQ